MKWTMQEAQILWEQVRVLVAGRVAVRNEIRALVDERLDVFSRCQGHRQLREYLARFRVCHQVPVMHPHLRLVPCL